MTTPVVVVGAGGFGRETIDIVAAVNREGGDIGFTLLGVIDDAPSPANLARLASLGVPHLGGIANWIETGEPAQYLLAVGSPAVRRKLVSDFNAAGRVAAGIVHPRAVLGSRVVIGRGTIICAGVQVSTNVALGDFVHLNPNSTVGHDTALGDYVSVNPGAVISGECLIGPEVLLGAGCVVLAGREVCERSIVGAAACVVRDVGVGDVVKGVPAR
jgi:sugar O-acyltransferase (sialic acid O-acetyltransferase NeuD family)